MLLLNDKEVHALLPLEKCIELMRVAFMAMADSTTKVPSREVLVSASKKGAMGMMPASSLGAGLGLKVATVYPGNGKLNLPTHQGVVLLFDPESGSPLACIDATSVTAVRTAAVAALATDLLANPNATRLSILGTGEQSLLQVEAILKVRNLIEVKLFGRNLEKATALASTIRNQFGINATAMVNAQDAIANTEILSTVTASAEPLFNAEALKPGIHLNAIGASRPGAREIPSLAILKSKVYVDSNRHALQESDEIRMPIQEGLITQDHIEGDLAELITGKIEGRTNQDQITLFKSVGNAIQDLFVARYLFNAAQNANFGSHFSLRAIL